MVSESLQWLCLLTLFLASVVTLIIYLVQYFGVFRSRSGTRAGGGECEEADRLLSWLLELKSWRTEWRRAWIRALNQNQHQNQNHRCSAQGAIQLVFEEDGVQSSELSVHHISSFNRSPGRKEVRNRISEVSSPPKPPRAHQWKLLVKNIRVTYSPEDGAAGSVSPQCVLQLDDPPQKMSTSVLNEASDPVWDQPFIFELSGKSKELNIQLLDHGKPSESCVLGEACVPFNLVTRSPRGQHTFTLMNTHQAIGSLTTELSYLEPSEVRTWQPPTPAPAKRVEMDRTVMPCGTVVTTVTAVRSRPGRPLPPETMKPPPRAKLTERRVSEQPSVLGAKVSKALSSSDTELLMLNGTDPVAEAAIRQLYESAKQKLKSPVKKSTIIISGVAKTPVSQDEMSLMADYASTMDASMAESPECTRQETDTLSEHCVSDTTDPLEGPSGADWESQTGEESDKASLSLCVSETRSKKGKGSFLHKGARLFFRRRQQRKEPGMSQSHNDLQYLEQAEERRTATFKRIINRKLLHKHKSKANGVQTSELHQPH
ncbi:hypothetical protein PDJAM_G00078790 [Pangasius djambal]|uniref:Uncharacterized protein n=1 Tax=Pangasius djambal TaxID=1691987 RepID=A0ACC5Z2A6_9TELE|nr:hypothetical protein [Pangasius djambal]